MMKKAMSPAAMVAKELKARFKKELGLKVTWSRSEYYERNVKEENWA